MMKKELDPRTGKPVRTSAGRFIGVNTVYGRDGEHGTPYMTRAWFGRLRLHIFHRPDRDPDAHDHPWDFWTFPLVSYVEEVVEPIGHDVAFAGDYPPYVVSTTPVFGRVVTRVVPAFRLSFRPATHCHRVLGAWTGEGRGRWTGTIVRMDAALLAHARAGIEPVFDPDKKITTLVWRSGVKRPWGFLKNRDGKWCWVAWREYVFAGGKDGPCQ